MTFAGFTVNSAGDLIDPVKKEMIESSIMTPELQVQLEENKVNFSDNYEEWKKNDMIKRICTVIGVENHRDPDESYVLTVDNVIKILAIQMRFR